ncbi:MAG TPA: BlaI/MecI/CopY family transcriptional regulator [Thermoanaerobaculia bacterium]|nr:BlaI/MecI/CopY family transcriptional regulator [Thermoanaerobaculia bacterium]
MRPLRVRLTRLELQLMDILWDLGTAAVREVQEAIPEKARPAYTTVQTILNRLEEKGAVRKTKKIGNAWIFEPVITRKKTHQRLIDDFLDVFGGSATPVVSHLLETGKITLADLKALEERLGKGKE